MFQAANGGTLFLDEVADLPLAMQVKLLRGIQEKAVRPVGSQQEVPVDVRILSATHKELAKEVERNTFRQDLYYRINVIELEVPNLRDRREDIPELAQYLLTKIGNEYQMKPPGLSMEALDTLQRYDFPGNVRELENTLERAFTLCEKDIIEPKDLGLNHNARNIAAPSWQSQMSSRRPKPRPQPLRKRPHMITRRRQQNQRLQYPVRHFLRMKTPSSPTSKALRRMSLLTR